MACLKRWTRGLPELVGNRKVLTTMFFTTDFIVSRHNWRFLGGAGAWASAFFLSADDLSFDLTLLLLTSLSDPLGVTSESESSSSLLSSVKVPPRPTTSVASKPTRDSRVINCHACVIATIQWSQRDTSGNNDRGKRKAQAW